jgi:hypothetical protein
MLKRGISFGTDAITLNHCREELELELPAGTEKRGNYPRFAHLNVHNPSIRQGKLVNGSRKNTGSSIAI